MLPPKPTGERVDDLTLAECLTYDPRPQQRGQVRRFRCPRHGGDNQKSLSIDLETGKFRCYNGGCLIWGTLVENQVRREPQSDWGRPRSGWRQPLPPLPIAAPLEENNYAVQRAVTAWKAFVGSPAAAYARARGIPPDLARALRLGYWRGEWRQEDSEWLTFPLRCPVTGKPVGVYGRNLHSDDPARKARVLGPRGLFGSARPGSLPVDVVLVEGAFEALAILASPGLPAVRAVIGASARAEWFDGCRRLTILFDDDPPGREATERLVTELNGRRARRGRGPQVLCLQPESLARRYGCKDLGELLARGIPIALDLPPLPTAGAAPEPAQLLQAVTVGDSFGGELAREAYQRLGETLPAGAIEWADTFRSDLTDALDVATARLDAAADDLELAAALDNLEAAAAAIAAAFPR